MQLYAHHKFTLTVLPYRPTKTSTTRPATASYQTTWRIIMDGKSQISRDPHTKPFKTRLHRKV